MMVFPEVLGGFGGCRYWGERRSFFAWSRQSAKICSSFLYSWFGFLSKFLASRVTWILLMIVFPEVLGGFGGCRYWGERRSFFAWSRQNAEIFHRSYIPDLVFFLNFYRVELLEFYLVLRAWMWTGDRKIPIGGLPNWSRFGVGRLELPGRFLSHIPFVLALGYVPCFRLLPVLSWAE